MAALPRGRDTKGGKGLAQKDVAQTLPKFFRKGLLLQSNQDRIKVQARTTSKEAPREKGKDFQGRGSAARGNG